MSEQLARLLSIMARLRDPQRGCEWDVAQTFETIAPYTIEEAYEVADAIERADMADLRGELGDLLLQVVFHARMAEEAGHFDYDDVARAIADKMVRRHPHVFGDADIATAEAQTVHWEDLKARERAEKGETSAEDASALDGVAIPLPALTRAEKLQKRAARIGFDWPEAEPVIAKIEEELAELRAEMAAGAPKARVEEEMGDLLFAVANLARHLKIDPETALRRGNHKFEDRFRRMEKRLRADGRDPADASLDEMEAAWQAEKAHDTPFD
ncbi:MAG: nucleoside triphosphate pyrophosphohydrolase [Rhodospirillaceae bacterium]|nr:nucleoside triphosphate pyrophosphohydrolase [Rhodospirillaceae bacterium]